MDFAASAFDIKSLNDSGSIEGLLAGFGNVDSHGDRILYGAFSKTLAARGERPLPMLLHHDMARPIGAWKSWQEREDGLYVKGTITLGTKDGQEAHALARDGALTGLSIGYKSTRGRRDDKTGGNELHEIDLYEGSLVSIPGNPATFVSAIKAIGSVRDIEDILHEAGMSGRKAKAAASAAWKAINTSNDDDEAEAQARAILNASAARIAAMGGTR